MEVIGTTDGNTASGIVTLGGGKTEIHGEVVAGHGATVDIVDGQVVATSVDPEPEAG